MKHFVMALSMIAVLASCGQSNMDTSGSVLAATAVTPVVVDEFDSRPVNGGINPSARAVEVSVSFRAGSNACFASMKKYEIKQINKGSEVHIVVNSVATKANRLACPMVFAPVQASLSTTVFSGTKNVKIIVDNVKVLGKNVVAKL